MNAEELIETEAYLHKVLIRETLPPGGPELTELKRIRDEVEELLREEFGDEPRIREGGSKAKKTMVRSAFDLDLTVYFPRDSDIAGSTIKEIYETVEKVLRKKYWTERKGVAIRLLDAGKRQYLHVDVVPGRFVDGDDGDVYVYPSSSDKERLKTNLDVHIEHIRDSRVREEIRLTKVWRNRLGIGVKTFALELLVVKLLKGRIDKRLVEQMVFLWNQFIEKKDDLTVEDPANGNNDLSELLDDQVRTTLAGAAAQSLDLVRQFGLDGWKQIFGPVPEDPKPSEALRQAALSGGTASSAKPWYRDGDSLV